MNIDEILLKIKKGEIEIEDAKKSLQLLTVKHIEDFAKLDICRNMRKGIPEIVFAENKTPREIVKIAKEMSKCSGRVIISRLSGGHLKELKKLKEKLNVIIFKNARMAVLS